MTAGSQTFTSVETVNAQLRAGDLELYFVSDGGGCTRYTTVDDASFPMQVALEVALADGRRVMYVSASAELAKPVEVDFPSGGVLVVQCDKRLLHAFGPGAWTSVHPPHLLPEEKQ